MNERADVLIIGGGAVGVCIAYYLAEQGRSVALIEKGEISSGSSYGNAGLIAVDHAIPTAAPGVLSQGMKWLLDADSPFYIKPRPDPDLVRWLWRFRGACSAEPMHRTIPVLLGLGQSSIELFDQLHEHHPLDDAYQRKGRLFLFLSQSGLEKGLKELHLLEEYGVTGRVLDAGEVQQMAPHVQSSVVGGIVYDGYAHLNPDRFVRELAGVVESMGVRMYTGTEVQGFETSGQRIASVTTAQGPFKADEIVLAAGVWSSPVARKLGIRLPIQAAKGYSITAKRPPAFPEIPLSLGEAKVAVTPMGELLRFSSTLEMSGFDMSINQRRVTATRSALRTYVSGMDALEELEVWRGLRPMTPDSLPIIDRSSAYKNFIVATGHGMLGITQGPITGKLVEQMIAGETSDLDMTPFRIERFS